MSHIYVLIHVHCAHTQEFFLFNKLHCFGVLHLCEINEPYSKFHFVRGMTDITEGGNLLE